MTVVAGVLAVASQLGAARVALIAVAVLTGQLVIGWSNDLLDAERDASSARRDKPLATGEVSRAAVRVSLGTAASATVALSLALGWRSGLTHVLVVVGSGVAYNLGLKATAWSWLPYATAFGSLPAVVSLAAPDPVLPAAWVVAASVSLGVAAHFLNILPDLDDDEATGVRGLPHRIGPAPARVAAAVLLVAASAAAVVGPPGPAPGWAWLVLLTTTALAAVALTGPGRLPFRAAVAIAVIDVTLLAVVSR